MHISYSCVLVALPNPLKSSVKRKAHAFEDDDSENIDPVIFLSPKRSKNPDGSAKDSLAKPLSSPQFYLTKAPPSPDDLTSPTFKPAAYTASRPTLTARSPAAKINTAVTRPSPLSAPAGRSPTRKRVGILSRRKTGGSPFTRVDPPKFGFSGPTSSGLGFSIDAALSGTVPSSHASRQRQTPASTPKQRELPVSLYGPEIKASWFFDIHEDTPEELATNLMEHSTCTLDISSDEESAARMKDERGKENVPPLDDISQTRTIITSLPASLSASSEASDIKPKHRGSRRSSRKDVDDSAIEIDRAPLGEMLAEDFYPEGCDGSSVVVIPASDAGAEADTAAHVDPVMETVPEEEVAAPGTESVLPPLDAALEVHVDEQETIIVDDLMQKGAAEEAAPPAALLCPIEKAEENFEVWESGSAKGDE